MVGPPLHVGSVHVGRREWLGGEVHEVDPSEREFMLVGKEGEHILTVISCTPLGY